MGDHTVVRTRPDRGQRRLAHHDPQERLSRRLGLEARPHRVHRREDFEIDRLLRAGVRPAAVAAPSRSSAARNRCGVAGRDWRLRVRRVSRGVGASRALRLGAPGLSMSSEPAASPTSSAPSGSRLLRHEPCGYSTDSPSAYTGRRRQLRATTLGWRRRMRSRCQR